MADIYYYWFFENLFTGFGFHDNEIFLTLPLHFIGLHNFKGGYNVLLYMEFSVNNICTVVCICLWQ